MYKSYVCLGLGEGEGGDSGLPVILFNLDSTEPNVEKKAKPSKVPLKEGIQKDCFFYGNNFPAPTILFQSVVI